MVIFNPPKPGDLENWTRHFTLRNIASQIDLLDTLIVAGVDTVLPPPPPPFSFHSFTLGYGLETGKLLNWIRKPWDLFKGWIEAGYTGPENELKSQHWYDKMNMKEAFSDILDSDSPDEEDDLVQLGFKGIGETYIAETYTGLRQDTDADETLETPKENSVEEFQEIDAQDAPESILVLTELEKPTLLKPTRLETGRAVMEH
ncbi:hypothetical protein OROHE_005252 [Orobanche hederae]